MSSVGEAAAVVTGAGEVGEVGVEGVGLVRQEAGQRRWGGPPEGWEGGAPPKRGAEVFVGKLPRDVDERELLPVLRRPGRLWELRLMVDFSGANRGFCFATYGSREEARRACAQLNNHELRPGKHMGVVMSIDNCKLFVGGIPRERQREEILAEMEKLVDGVTDVIVYPSATDKSKNRGFAFVELDSHKAAAQARRKLGPSGKVQLWGQPICVDWAEPEQEVDEQTMATVRVLYVRNLMLSTTEDSIRAHFDALQPGAVERVKKLKDYAFVHYTNRQAALDNLDKLNGSLLDGAVLEVQLSKPPDKSVMRYVKSAQKNSGLSMHTPQGAGLTQEIVAAATQNFLQHQAAVHPALPLAAPTDPVAWALTGTPFVHAPAQLLPAGLGQGLGLGAAQQSPEAASRAAALHRGAAGMRSAGFVAHVNKHVRNARNRRSADAALLPFDPHNYPYPPVLAPLPSPTLPSLASPLPAPVSVAGGAGRNGVVWLPAAQAQHLQTLQVMALQQQLGLGAGAGAGAKATEQLAEYCRVTGLGVAEVSVEEVVTADVTGAPVTLYTAAVSLPALAGLAGGSTPLGKSGNPFRSAEEARECAAHLALIQLGAAAASLGAWGAANALAPQPQLFPAHGLPQPQPPPSLLSQDAFPPLNPQGNH